MNASSSDLLTRTQLRELRLRPAPDQAPVSTYWSGHAHVPLYARADAVPLPPKRQISAAQAAVLARGRLMARTTPCAGGCGTRIDATPDRIRQWRRQGIQYADLCDACRDAELEREHQANERRRQQHLAQTRTTAREWLAGNPVFLDTETTGLGLGDEVLEIAVLDVAGNVLIESLVRPAQACSEEARAVHGISDAELAGAPAWSEIAPDLARALAGRLVVCHNADFDRGRLLHSCRLHGVQVPAPAGWRCTMDLLTDPVTARWPSLGEAMRIAGASGDDVRHRARGDAESVRRIVQTLATGGPS